MIWIFAVSIIVYLAVGFIITHGMVKSQKVDNVVEFWWFIVFWLPILLSKALIYILKAFFYAPKQFADWHINKFGNPPKTPITRWVAPPPKRP